MESAMNDLLGAEKKRGESTLMRVDAGLSEEGRGGW